MKWFWLVPVKASKPRLWLQQLDPPRVVYSLTEKAIALVPVFAAIDAWGIKYLPTSPAMAAAARVVAEGGPEVAYRLMDELRAIHLHDRTLPTAEDSVLREMGAAALNSQ